MLLKILMFILVVLPFMGSAHPGIGMVKDNKNNIYYTDLQQVWKISNGQKTIVVPGVHTHELYIDKDDNLYGENMLGGSETSNKFFHYLWRLQPNGDLDTLEDLREAYINIDFSLARDLYGNEYYIKQFLKRPDTNHIYKKYPGGKEVVLARGNFKGVTWLHPQKDESLLFVLHNNVYRVSKDGVVKELAKNIANEKPSFAFSGNSKTVWGVWQDDSNNVYVAVFSDQAVKKINSQGEVSDHYKTKGNWAPLYGLFDNKNRLWVLESSDKNEVRVTMAETKPNIIKSNNKSFQFFYFGIGIIVLGALLYYIKIR